MPWWLQPRSRPRPAVLQRVVVALLLSLLLLLMLTPAVLPQVAVRLPPGRSCGCSCRQLCASYHPLADAAGPGRWWLTLKVQHCNSSSGAAAEEHH
jgi:hypothetical protein